MSNSSQNSIGDSRQKFEKFVIPIFPGMVGGRAECLKSPIMSACGYKWRLCAFPRSLEDGGNSPWTRDFSFEFVTVSLELCQPHRKLDVEYFFVVNRTRGTSRTSPVQHTVDWGISELPKRDIILGGDWKDVSLVIECNIRVLKPVWYPTVPPYVSDLPVASDLEVYANENSESSMVCFSIGDKLHQVDKSVLSLRCKGLYDIANDCDDGSRIPIEGTQDDVFEILIGFVRNPREFLIPDKETAVKLLVAADRYDCNLLKLYVESVLVDAYLKQGTAAEMLLLGDSYTCPLLKEKAMEVYAANQEAVENADAWSTIQESNMLLEELIDHLQRALQTNGEQYPSDIALWDVASLRERLQWYGLELDGSRKMLVDRLKDYEEEDRNQ